MYEKGDSVSGRLRMPDGDGQFGLAGKRRYGGRFGRRTRSLPTKRPGCGLSTNWALAATKPPRPLLRWCNF